jgi:molybdate transport system substrate-binding protein
MKSPCSCRRIAWLAGLLWAAVLHAADITVFAAASLSDSLKAVAADYEKTTGDKVRFNFGASSLLVRQIQEGAPADLFFSAEEAKMDVLERKQLLLKGTRRSRLSNTLVIVVAAERGAQVTEPSDLAFPRIKRIALAEPATVPAGIYAKAYLEQKRLWPSLAGKVVPTENVRAALSAVESGNADAGIVYKTDATISKKVKVAYEVPASETPGISYPIAVINGSKDAAAARRFLEHVNSQRAGEVFHRFGFIVRE